MDGEGKAGWRAEVTFLRRVLIAGAVVALALLLWHVRTALLLAFAGVLVAVLLLALARPMEARLGLSRTWSLAAVTLGLLLLVLGAGVLVGAQVIGQVSVLAEQLPRAVAALEHRFGLALPSLRDMLADAAPDAATLGALAGRVAGIGSMAVSALSALVLVAVGGVFLAVSPAEYRRGLLALLPRSRHEDAEAALLASGEALRLWLGAQFISMVIVGLAAGLGCWALGLPSPLAIGLFAGLAGFVPLIGSVAGAVPALLLALAEGGTLFLWTGLLFLLIQQVESNMVMPLVERNMVSIPPALLLFAVVAVGLLFGLPGVILAAPITVVAFVLVKKLYVRETLRKETDVPGEA